MKNKILSFFMAAAIIATSCIISADISSAAEAEDNATTTTTTVPSTDIIEITPETDLSKYLSYEITDEENNEITITDFYKYLKGDLVIPEKIDGYKVTAIGEYAFRGCRVNRITIADTIEYIGFGAFEGSHIEEITIGKSVKEIEGHAFFECYYLKTINYNSIFCNEVDGGVYGYAIPDGLYGWFQTCYAVTTINIGESVEFIPDFAFTGCRNLERANFPDTVINISNGAFWGCVNVSIYCKAGSYAQYYAERNGIETILTDDVSGDYIVKNRVLIGYENENSANNNIIIPPDVSTVGYGAFINNTELENIELPYSVTHIYSSAFEGCPNLKRVIIPYTVTSIGENAFKDTNATIVCYNGSYAHKYAKENGIDFELIALNFNTDNLMLTSGETYLATVQASHAVACGVPSVWESSDNNVVEIDVDGNITAINIGSAEISAIAPNGVVLGKCKVTVLAKDDIVEITDTSVNSINFGDTLVLTIGEVEIPEGYMVEWFVEGAGVATSVSEDGMECRVTSIANGNAVISVRLVDENGEAITNADGEVISDEITITSKAGFWLKLVSFFKNLFGINRVIY